MKVMKTYRQIMLFAALFFSFEAVSAQSAHIGDGSLGTSVIDSMVYSRDSVIAGQPHRVYDMYVRACEYYTWNGHRESASVVKTPILCYNDNFTRDSLVSLHLTVKRLGYATYTPLPECDSIEFRGRWYTQSYAGDYSMVQNENIYSVDGCDSVYFLSLTVRGHSTEKVYTLENCNTFSWPIPWVLNIDPVPRVYTSSTSDTVHTLNVDGCDSTIVLNLTVWYGDTLTDTQNVCDRYTWAGHTYTSSTVADHHFRTVHNCDSLVTLDLTAATNLQRIGVSSFEQIEQNLPLELPSVGTGWYGDPAVQAIGPDGNNITKLRFADYKILPHKEPLEGLPSVGSGSARLENDETLEILLKDEIIILVKARFEISVF